MRPNAPACSSTSKITKYESRNGFDTDAPHKRPWESLGFTIKPDYWDTRYGTAPYTRGNLVLWNDIANGFIAEGNRKGFYPRYAKGSNFLNVLQEVRSRVALRYLADDRLGITEIAFLLGYADQGSFSSAFKSWHGVSPRDYRQK